MPTVTTHSRKFIGLHVVKHIIFTVRTKLHCFLYM
jgi:hypothetical protein